MKKLRIVMLIVLVFALLVPALVACSGNDTPYVVKVQNFKGIGDVVVNEETKTITGNVSSEITQFDTSNIVLENGVTFKVFEDESCTKALGDKISLKDGENVVYLKITVSDGKKSFDTVWTLKITKVTTLSINSVVVKEFKAEYNVGDTFAEGVLTVKYSNDNQVDVVITRAMVTGFDTVTAGAKEVTIEYFGHKVKTTIVVNANSETEQGTVTAIEVTNWEDQYAVGEAFKSGNILQLTFEDNTTKDIAIKADMVSGFDTATKGIKTVTITYGEFALSKTIWVENELVESAITFEQIADCVVDISKYFSYLGYSEDDISDTIYIEYFEFDLRRSIAGLDAARKEEITNLCRKAGITKENLDNIIENVKKLGIAEIVEWASSFNGFEDFVNLPISDRNRLFNNLRDRAKAILNEITSKQYEVIIEDVYDGMMTEYVKVANKLMTLEDALKGCTTQEEKDLVKKFYDKYVNDGFYDQINQIYKNLDMANYFRTAVTLFNTVLEIPNDDINTVIDTVNGFIADEFDFNKIVIKDIVSSVNVAGRAIIRAYQKVDFSVLCDLKDVAIKALEIFVPSYWEYKDDIINMLEDGVNIIPGATHLVGELLANLSVEEAGPIYTDIDAMMKAKTEEKRLTELGSVSVGVSKVFMSAYNKLTANEKIAIEKYVDPIATKIFNMVGINLGNSVDEIFQMIKDFAKKDIKNLTNEEKFEIGQKVMNAIEIKYDSYIAMNISEVAISSSMSQAEIIELLNESAELVFAKYDSEVEEYIRIPFVFDGNNLTWDKSARGVVTFTVTYVDGDKPYTATFTQLVYDDETSDSFVLQPFSGIGFRRPLYVGEDYDFEADINDGSGYHKDTLFNYHLTFVNMKGYEIYLSSYNYSYLNNHIATINIDTSKVGNFVGYLTIEHEVLGKFSVPFNYSVVVTEEDAILESIEIHTQGMYYFVTQGGSLSGHTFNLYSNYYIPGFGNYHQEVEITDDMVSNFDSSKLGLTTAILTYQGKQKEVIVYVGTKAQGEAVKYVNISDLWNYNMTFFVGQDNSIIDNMIVRYSISYVDSRKDESDEITLGQLKNILKSKNIEVRVEGFDLSKEKFGADARVAFYRNGKRVSWSHFSYNAVMQGKKYVSYIYANMQNKVITQSEAKNLKTAFARMFEGFEISYKIYNADGEDSSYENLTVEEFLTWCSQKGINIELPSEIGENYFNCKVDLGEFYFGYRVIEDSEANNVTNVSLSANRKVFIVGQEIGYDINVVVTYGDGYKVEYIPFEQAGGYIEGTYDMNKVGEYALTLKYAGNVGNTIKIKVITAQTSQTVTAMKDFYYYGPSEYYIGQEFNKDFGCDEIEFGFGYENYYGMKWEVRESAQIIGFDNTKEGAQAVTIKFSEYVSYTVNVIVRAE